MVVQHNITAAYAAMQINKNSNALSKATAKLSSGYKVNSAADNAAALSVSEGMRAQIRSLNKSANNIQDGMSYVQVADGALDEVTKMLQRINELSIQSANDTNTPEDRAAINSEISQIKLEMNRVFADTEFNTKKIWNTDNEQQVQIGTESKNIAQYNAAFNMPITDTTKGYVPVEAVQISIQNSAANPEQKAMVFSWKGADGGTYTSEAYDINPQGGSVTISRVKKNGIGPDVNLAGSNLSFSYKPDKYASYDQLVNSIDSTVIQVYAYTSESVQVGVNGAAPSSSFIGGLDGSCISFTTSLYYQSQYNAGQNFSDPTPDDGFIEPSTSTNHTAFSSDNASDDSYSFILSKQSNAVATATINSISYSSSYRDAGRFWSYVDQQGREYVKPNNINHNNNLDEIYKMLSGDGSNKSILTDTNGVGGTIQVSYGIASNGTYIGQMTMNINISSASAQKAMSDSSYKDTLFQAIKNSINSITSLDITSDNSASYLASTYSNGISTSNNTYDAPIFKATQNLMIQTGAVGQQGISIEYDALRDYTLGIEDIDVTTYEGAQDAIEKVANALNIVADQRALFGAYANRLEHAYNTNTNTAENTQAAESLLRDTDMADEMVEYSKRNTLIQSAQSMLGQANKQSSSILDLLS